MSVFVVASSALAAAPTLRDAGRQVARVVGGQDDPEEVGAYDAIRNVLRRLNGDFWDYLQVRGDDIQIFDHETRTIGQEGYQGQYTLPTAFRDLISARLKDQPTDEGGMPLEMIHRGEHDQKVTGITTGMGTRFVCFFPLGLTQKMELLDWPGDDAYLELRYWRPIAIPQDLDEGLDIPGGGPLEEAVILLAKAIVAVDRGDLRKARAVREEGERVLGKAKMVDRVFYTENRVWEPEWIWRRNQPRLTRDYPWGTF